MLLLNVLLKITWKESSLNLRIKIINHGKINMLLKIHILHLEISQKNIYPKKSWVIKKENLSMKILKLLLLIIDLKVLEEVLVVMLLLHLIKREISQHLNQSVELSKKEISHPQNSEDIMIEVISQSRLIIWVLLIKLSGKSHQLNSIIIIIFPSSLMVSEKELTHTDFYLFSEPTICWKREVLRFSPSSHNWSSQSRLPWTLENLILLLLCLKLSKDWS